MDMKALGSFLHSGLSLNISHKDAKSGREHFTDSGPEVLCFSGCVHLFPPLSGCVAERL